MTLGEVFVRAADDVLAWKKVVAKLDGSLTCPKRGRRRNGAIDMRGAIWLTTTAKGEIGRIRLCYGMRPVRRKIAEEKGD